MCRLFQFAFYSPSVSRFAPRLYVSCLTHVKRVLVLSRYHTSSYKLFQKKKKKKKGQLNHQLSLYIYVSICFDTYEISTNPESCPVLENCRIGWRGLYHFHAMIKTYLEGLSFFSLITLVKIDLASKKKKRHLNPSILAAYFGVSRQARYATTTQNRLPGTALHLSLAITSTKPHFFTSILHPITSRSLDLPPRSASPESSISPLIEMLRN